MNHNHGGHMWFMGGLFALTLLLRSDLSLVLNIALVGAALALGLVYWLTHHPGPRSDDQHRDGEHTHHH